MVGGELLPDARLENLTDFMLKIEDVRSSLLEKEWTDFCKKNIQLAEWRYFLCDDPYTRHGLLKPRGYPGDAGLMDFAYQHRSVSKKIENSTETGRQIYSVTSKAEQSQSARERVDLVADIIKRKLIDQNNGLRIASFASGHARELETLSEQSESVNEFIPIDTDRRSVAEVVRAYGSRISVRPIYQNVFRVSPQEVGVVDLAYSMGLFDYLAAGAAKNAIRIMRDTVAPGGTLLVGNLSTEAANLAYCEGVMDWWMVSRTEDDMRELGALLEANGEWNSKVIRKGCFFYILANRYV